MVALLIALGVAVVVLLIWNRRLAWRQRTTQAMAGTSARASLEPPQTVNGETPQTANVAVLTRYEIWMRRVRREQLGAGDEDWNDLSGTAQYGAWRQLAEARGGRADVPGYLTRSLLSEVLYAAGGVERELGAAAQGTGRSAAAPRRSDGPACSSSGGTADCRLVWCRAARS